ncbi:hypothetical protein EDB92DRAFT_1820706 [Lactarius akahatsu]|uniref:Uncharacterized protein n=1 Tax=Lactarius akahatsu TaxID=416441 RepID=A0AAD4L4K7_9AGAM|nr:hypothetical protein EDB92DRAFT_1820706 [Lactarius akahatsu]
MACTDSLVSPSFPCIPANIIPPSTRSSFQTHPTCARTLSSPAFLRSPTESAQAPTLPQRIIRRPDDADACIAQLADAPHFAALVRTLTQRAYPPHTRPVLCAYAGVGAALYARALGADTELLAAALGTLTHLTQLADTLPYAFFNFSRRQPARVLPTSRCPILSACPLQRTTSHPPPFLAVLNSSPGYVAALAPGRPLWRVMRIASCMTACAPWRCFGAVGGSLKEIVVGLAPDVDVRMRVRLSGVLANTSTGLEVLELSLEGHFR